MATVTGIVDYRNVIGSSLKDRSAFDGSVPYSISCASDVRYVNGDAETVVTTNFSLVGIPGSYSIGAAATKSGLSKQCVVRLRDFWVEVTGNEYRGKTVISVAACDPNSSFPGPTVVNTHLYDCTCENGVIRIPDIEGIVVSAGLNIVINLSSDVAANGNVHFLVHCVTDIDD